jgi:fatty-acyl-CoA synthase
MDTLASRRSWSEGDENEGERKMWIEATTIGDLLDRAASETDQDAVVFPDTRVTYPELSALTDHFARAIRGLGVGPGDKVGILMPNCLEFVAVLIGASKLGAIPVPINGRFKTHELNHVIAHADMTVLFTAAEAPGTDYPRLLREVFPGLAGEDPPCLQLEDAPYLRNIVDLRGAAPGCLTRDDLDARVDDVTLAEVKRLQRSVRIRDVAMLMYTSGTTSKPKGCLLSHEGLIRNAITIWRDGFSMTAEDRFWDPLPLFHIGGIVPLFGCFAARATFCHAGYFDPAVALRMLADERCSVAYPTFETIWLAVLDHPRFPHTDLSALRLIHNVGVPERLLRMQERLPSAVQFCVFGMTECCSHLTHPSNDDPPEVRATTLGYPLPGLDVRIVDPETAKERPVGEVGELCFRGYTLFEGYYKAPELTEAAIDVDGFFHTGDLAFVDGDGRLSYAGRLKDMLKVGGENVSALEVEDYLARHAAVGIVQVVGMSDSRYEEVPVAFVQLKPGAVTTEDELIEFCRGKIASYKVPRRVRFVQEWPMSGTKIQKFVLRQQAEDELAAETPAAVGSVKTGPSS